MQVDEGIDEIGDRGADVEEKDELVVEVEVEGIRHGPLQDTPTLDPGKGVHHKRE